MNENLYVFAAALGTAFATGLGAVPFFFTRNISDRVLSLANAATAGLMLAASVALLDEGFNIGAGRTLIGMLLGVAMVLVGAVFIKEDPLEHPPTAGLSLRGAVMLVAIMTVHSAAEGIGIGVGQGAGAELGTFIILALAIHNVAEGLAISLALVPHGASPIKAAAWGVFSSLPQPLLAVPAFIFVNQVASVLPIGLGIAAGAMIWMSIGQLLPASLRGAGDAAVGTTVTLAMIAMLGLQLLLRG